MIPQEMNVKQSLKIIQHWGNDHSTYYIKMTRLRPQIQKRT